MLAQSRPYTRRVEIETHFPTEHGRWLTILRFNPAQDGAERLLLVVKL